MTGDNHSASTHLTVHRLDADLAIVGGGMAGTVSALAAARNGIKVVLVQDRSVLGGNASSEVRMHIVGADEHGKKAGLRETGIMEELRLEDAARNPHRSFSQWDLLLYEKVKAEPNITLLLDTTCVGVEMAAAAGEGGSRIAAVRALRNSTEDEFLIAARWFADCSGDGRLGVEAGADHTVGREASATHDESHAPATADNLRLGSSIMFMAREVATPQTFIAPDWIRKFTRDDFKLRPISSYEYGYWWFEWGGHLDTIKDNEEIRHELLRIALGVWDYVKNSGDHPNSANWALDWVAPIPGKRESRRFLGTYVLTERDILNPAARADAVAYGGWSIDLHPINGIDAVMEHPSKHTSFPHVYSIPFGCYCSRNVGNLLFAGRNISATHIAFGSTRVMATCAIGGQAVGTAAALLTQRRATTTADLASPEGLKALRQRLTADDAFLPGETNQDETDLARHAAVSASSEADGTPAVKTIDGITRNLRSEWGPWSDGQGHLWRSTALPATLRFELRQPAPISAIHLVFDTGLERQLILSGSDHTTATTVRGPQPETAKHYQIRIDGTVVADVPGNYLRHRIHHLPTPITGRVIEIEIFSTHGVPDARVFEVRLRSA